MIVLQVITLADLGGAQSVLINLCHSLINDGHNVIVASESTGPMWDILPDKVEKIRLKKLQRSIHPIKDFRLIFSLRKLYKKYKPDVIHLHSSKIGLIGRLAFPKTKIIYTVHGFDSIRIANRKFLFLERLLKNNAKHIVGVSRYDYNNLISEKIDKNVTYIYNGVADYRKDEFNICDPINNIRKNFSYIILTIARLSSQKRFDLFCEVANLLKNNNVAFVWIGNQYEPQNIPDNVFCLGNIKNAYQYIPSCDIFMLPSNYEGLPISIIESLVFGKPIIASNVGGISEILDGTNGFVLNNDPNQFSEKILFYINNKEAYSATCKVARKTYEDKFTVTQMYKKYLSLYKDISKL